MMYLISIILLPLVLANPLADFPKQETMIPLVTFDGNPETTFRFRQQNDPVMVRIQIELFHRSRII